MAIKRELIVLTFLFIALLATVAAAQEETVLYSFQGNGGSEPTAGLILDSAGNLFGTTSSDPVGAVFELTPSQGGGWTEIVLHTFTNTGSDGQYPYGGLVFDRSGNLYGTTFSGGKYNAGTVFELTRCMGDSWSERILHNFNSGNQDGFNPTASLVIDSSGNLYGTTTTGGTYGSGTVFELERGANRKWTERILHSFNNNGTDGVLPASALTLDSSGNVYGTANGGGTYGGGVVFEMKLNTNGTWSEIILHDFNKADLDGLYPDAGVTLDSDGNLYGTTTDGGRYGGGTVFKLRRETNDSWSEAILHNFRKTNGDGYGPYAGVTFDSTGNLYGTTVNGGAYNYGAVFELIKSGWKETILHSFNFNGTDGFAPSAGLIIDADDNLYGTTSYGGTRDLGAVFEIEP